MELRIFTFYLAKDIKNLYKVQNVLQITLVLFEMTKKTKLKVLIFSLLPSKSLLLFSGLSARYYCKISTKMENNERIEL